MLSPGRDGNPGVVDWFDARDGDGESYLVVTTPPAAGDKLLLLPVRDGGLVLELDRCVGGDERGGRGRCNEVEVSSDINCWCCA